MTASLLFLPGLVVGVFVMLFATTALERLIGLPPPADGHPLRASVVAAEGRPTSIVSVAAYSVPSTFQ